jgi:transketolase
VGAAKVPELVGGSADLAPSTLTLIKDGGDVEAGSSAAATCTSASASTPWARSSTASS